MTDLWMLYHNAHCWHRLVVVVSYQLPEHLLISLSAHNCW